MAGSHRPRSQGQLRSQPEALPRVERLELLSPTHAAEGSGRCSSCPNLSLKPDTILKAGRPLQTSWQDVGSSDSGLATTTKLQNSLKMKYDKRLHSACYGADNEGCGPEVETEAQNHLMNEENFADDVAHLTNVIEDLSKLIRFDHLQKSDARMLKLEAARREKEAELRRARKKEQMAKDPSRKVAFKIERGRREKQEMLETLAKVPNAELSMRRMSQDIPLVPFHAPGCGTGNKEPVPVVDIKKIQRSCEGLGHHQNASELLQLRRRREVEKSTSCSFVGLNEYKWFSANSLLDGFTLEDRLAKVKAQRDDLIACKMRRRLLNMRSECPEYLCRAWGLASAVDSPEVSLLLDSDSDSDWNGSEAVSRRGSVNSSRRSSEDKPTGKKKLHSKRTVNSLTPAAFGKGRRASARINTELKNDVRKQLERMRKIRTRWVCLRACVQWLKLLFRKQRLDRSVDTCLVLLRQLGEWVRIRGALKQFMNNVKNIQRTVREYLAMKRRRCHLIEKEWCRVEDMHLAAHAQFRAQKAMQEKDKTSKVKSKRRILQAALEASVSSKWKLVVDFSSQRIPVAERRAVIAAYHKKAIKRHMYIGKTFLQLVFDALRARRELDNFLNQFHYGGATKSVVESLEIRKEDLITTNEKDSSECSYWQMPEAIILNLVACCAQGLEHVGSFKEHPANQAIPDSKRNLWPDYVVGSDPYEFADVILIQLDRPVYRGRFGRHPAVREADIIAEESKRNAAGAKRSSILSTQRSAKKKEGEEEVEEVFTIRDVGQALKAFSPPGSLGSPTRKDRKLHSLTSSLTLGTLGSTFDLEPEDGPTGPERLPTVLDSDCPLSPDQDFSASSPTGTDLGGSQSMSTLSP